MSIHRYARKRDANEKQIVAALRKVGCTVVHLDKPLDLLVGYRGETILIEVKDPAQPPAKRKLKPDQQEFIDGWRGGPVAVIEDVPTVLTMLRGYEGG